MLSGKDVDNAEVFYPGQPVPEEIGKGRDTVKSDEWSIQKGGFQIGCSAGREDEVTGGYRFIVVPGENFKILKQRGNEFKNNGSLSS